MYPPSQAHAYVSSPSEHFPFTHGLSAQSFTSVGKKNKEWRIVYQKQGHFCDKQTKIAAQLGADCTRLALMQLWKFCIVQKDFSKPVVRNMRNPVLRSEESETKFTKMVSPELFSVILGSSASLHSSQSKLSSPVSRNSHGCGIFLWMSHHLKGSGQMQKKYDLLSMMVMES